VVIVSGELTQLGSHELTGVHDVDARERRSLEHRECLLAALRPRVAPHHECLVIAVQLVSQLPAGVIDDDRLSGEQRLDYLRAEGGRAAHPALSLLPVPAHQPVAQCLDVFERPIRAQLDRLDQLARVGDVRVGLLGPASEKVAWPIWYALRSESSGNPLRTNSRAYSTAAGGGVASCGARLLLERSSSSRRTLSVLAYVLLRAPDRHRHREVPGESHQ
jgi:hypothetical protein